MAKQLGVPLKQDDLVLVSNVLNEVLHGPAAIEEAEFHARLGATRDEAFVLLQRISRLIGRG